MLKTEFVEGKWNFSSCLHIKGGLVEETLNITGAAEAGGNTPTQILAE